MKFVIRDPAHNSVDHLWFRENHLRDGRTFLKVANEVTFMRLPCDRDILIVKKKTLGKKRVLHHEVHVFAVLPFIDGSIVVVLLCQWDRHTSGDVHMFPARQV